MRNCRLHSHGMGRRGIDWRKFAGALTTSIEKVPMHWMMQYIIGLLLITCYHSTVIGREREGRMCWRLMWKVMTTRYITYLLLNCMISTQLLPFDECWVEGFDELYGRHCEAVWITTADWLRGKVHCQKVPQGQDRYGAEVSRTTWHALDVTWTILYSLEDMWSVLSEQMGSLCWQLMWFARASARGKTMPTDLLLRSGPLCQDE